MGWREFVFIGAPFVGVLLIVISSIVALRFWSGVRRYRVRWREVAQFGHVRRRGRWTLVVRLADGGVLAPRFPRSGSRLAHEPVVRWHAAVNPAAEPPVEFGPSAPPPTLRRRRP